MVLAVHHDNYGTTYPLSADHCHVTVSTGSMCLKFQCLSVSPMNGMPMEIVVLLTVKVKMKA